MFGFLTKKKEKELLKSLIHDTFEQSLNSRLFEKNFATIFDSETFNSAKLPNVEKLWVYSNALAQMVSDKATNSDKKICEYDLPKKTASVIVFLQAVEILAAFIKFTDKETLLNIYYNGGVRLLREEVDKPIPTEQAEFSHSILMRSMMIKKHFDIIQSINDNCLEYLFKQEDEYIDNIVADWNKIVAILS